FTNSNIAVFSIDQTTGALTFLSSIDTATNSYFVSIDPTSSFVFQTSTCLNSTPPCTTGVQVFKFDSSSGTLTPAPGSPTVLQGHSPGPVVTDLSGHLAFVLYEPGPCDVFSCPREGQVDVFQIDGQTGALSFVGGVDTQGTFPMLAELDPAGRFYFVLN